MTLSWDLFIIVFIATIMAYSVIIGKTDSVRVVIATYISILATQGIGNILIRLTGQSQGILSTMGIPMDITVISIAKVILFIFLVIALAVQSGIAVSYERDGTTLMNLVYTMLFGLSTGALMVSTVLSYAFGKGILDPTITSSSITQIAGSGIVMQVMILNQDIWFTLPAILLVVVGFLKNR